MKTWHVSNAKCILKWHSKVMSLFPKFAYARGAYDVSLKDKTVPATYAFDGNTTILC